ncbi:hypothetical protein BREVNS_1415 [Brevinematales bacterium NS]|nr:hypothetical protein BREVNS_1415 [Brevinematales bacterium NS]
MINNIPCIRGNNLCPWLKEEKIPLITSKKRDKKKETLARVAIC